MSIKHVCITMGLEIAKSIFAETLICVSLPNLQVVEAEGASFSHMLPEFRVSKNSFHMLF